MAVKPIFPSRTPLLHYPGRSPKSDMDLSRAKQVDVIVIFLEEKMSGGTSYA